jgi:hypothetical protein
MNPIFRLNELLNTENIKPLLTATEEGIVEFTRNNGLILPDDLIEYFKVVDGTSGKYDEKFFSFYSLKAFTNLNVKFRNWEGTPNYRNIFNGF